MTLQSEWLPGKTHAGFFIDGRRISIKTNLVGSGISLRWRGIDVATFVRSPRVAALARLMPQKPPPDTSRLLLCSTPGVVIAIAAKEGGTVEVGQALAAVEAMKMENILKAERRGVVKCIAIKPGQNLAVDELILEFE